MKLLLSPLSRLGFGHHLNPASELDARREACVLADEGDPLRLLVGRRVIDQNSVRPEVRGSYANTGMSEKLKKKNKG